MEKLLLGNILLKNANDCGLAGKVALVSGECRMTYAELNIQANKLGNGLIDLGGDWWVGGWVDIGWLAWARVATPTDLGLS